MDLNGNRDLEQKYSYIMCWFIFLICVLARIVEYFFIRTDESFVAENVLHKVFGIVLLFIVLKLTKSSWESIGFTKIGIASNILKGLLLGTTCFTVAYAAECFIQYMACGNVSLSFYASGFSLSGEMKQQTGLLFVAMCVVMNLINVWMEEGIFRGLFTKLLADRNYMKSVFFIAFLFGIWHLVMPLRDYLEARSSLTEFLVMGIGYIILAGVMSVKWSILYKMTGSLWMGLGDHLFNNVIVTNLVHVIANGEADSLQIVRIIIGQLLSFGIVMFIYKRRQKQMR